MPAVSKESGSATPFPLARLAVDGCVWTFLDRNSGFWTEPAFAARSLPLDAGRDGRCRRALQRGEGPAQLGASVARDQPNVFPLGVEVHALSACRGEPDHRPQRPRAPCN